MKTKVLTAKQILTERYMGILDHKNIWIYSKNGVDCNFIYDYYGRDNVYHKGKDKWFDYYTGQKCILIEDVDRQFMRKCGIHILTRIGDIYPLQVDKRYGYVTLFPKDYSVIITSRYSPDILMERMDIPYIRRRFCIIQFPYSPTKSGN